MWLKYVWDFLQRETRKLGLCHRFISVLMFCDLIQGPYSQFRELESQLDLLLNNYSQEFHSAVLNHEIKAYWLSHPSQTGTDPPSIENTFIFSYTIINLLTLEMKIRSQPFQNSCDGLHLANTSSRCETANRTWEVKSCQHGGRWCGFEFTRHVAASPVIAHPYLIRTNSDEAKASRGAATVSARDARRIFWLLPSQRG